MGLECSDWRRRDQEGKKEEEEGKEEDEEEEDNKNRRGVAHTFNSSAGEAGSVSRRPSWFQDSQGH